MLEILPLANLPFGPSNVTSLEIHLQTLTISPYIYTQKKKLNLARGKRYFQDIIDTKAKQMTPMF